MRFFILILFILLAILSSAIFLLLRLLLLGRLHLLLELLLNRGKLFHRVRVIVHLGHVHRNLKLVVLLHRLGLLIRSRLLQFRNGARHLALLRLKLGAPLIRVAHQSREQLKELLHIVHVVVHVDVGHDLLRYADILRVPHRHHRIRHRSIRGNRHLQVLNLARIATSLRLHFTVAHTQRTNQILALENLAIEPWMLLDLGNGDALLWVIAQHLLQHVLARLVIANRAASVELPKLGRVTLGQRAEPAISVVRLLKRRIAGNQNKEHHAHRKHIARQIVRLVEQQLWRLIATSAHIRRLHDGVRIRLKHFR
mmetsp:Transcript_25751/g.42063  ORF Transcript_25751/g.42063 Transcript_25751/m.42063 type:complete len:311 (+) Transcript_25751:918-1850(+)